MEKRKLTPPEVARQFGCKVEKVHAWIRSGELRAMNGAIRRDSGKPRFLIDVADLESFELARAVVPAPKPARRSRRYKSINAGPYYQ